MPRISSNFLFFLYFEFNLLDIRHFFFHFLCSYSVGLASSKAPGDSRYWAPYHTPPDTEGSVINKLVTATLAAASCPDSSEVTRFEHSLSRADSKIQNSLKNQK